VPVAAVAADSSDAAALRFALDTARERFGVPDVVVYDAAIVRPDLPDPKPDDVSLFLGKARVRALVTVLDKQYGTAFDPDDIAERYRSAWRST